MLPKERSPGRASRSTPSKTRVQFKGSRQVTTGLLVNEKPNIRPEYYRNARAMCWSLFNTGEYYRNIPVALAGGKASDSENKEIVTALPILEGVLSHIHYVRDHVDTRNSSDKKKEQTATRKLYFRFLFYKNFIVSQKPVIITEGKTDSIYLRAAIEKLTAYHPRLGEINDGKLKLTISFLNFSQHGSMTFSSLVMVPEIFYIIRQYHDYVKKYGHRPMPYPVIVLFDNDDGAKEIFKVAKRSEWRAFR